MSRSSERIIVGWISTNWVQSGTNFTWWRLKRIFRVFDNHLFFWTVARMYMQYSYASPWSWRTGIRNLKIDISWNYRNRENGIFLFGRKEVYNSTQEALLTSSTNDQDAFNILVFMQFKDLHTFNCLYKNRPKMQKEVVKREFGVQEESRWMRQWWMRQ